MYHTKFINRRWKTFNFILNFNFSFTFQTLPSVHKFGKELRFWKEYFAKMVTLKIFKNFLGNIHLVKKNVPTVGKKRLFLVVPYLKIISLQIRTKVQQTLKAVLNRYKLESVKQGFLILSGTKTLYSKILYLVSFFNFSVVSEMNLIMTKVSKT